MRNRLIENFTIAFIWFGAAAGLLLIVQGVFESEALATGISALGTFLLAAAAFMAIRTANERDKRWRKERKNTEIRDRKIRLLDDIIQWAIDIHGAIFTLEVPLASDEKTRRAALGNILQRHQYFAIRKRYIEGAASIFGLDDKVKVITDKTGTLQEYTNTVVKYMDKPSILKEYLSKLDSLLSSANDLLESATNIKTGMITES